jgi:predicted deacylase
MMNPASSPLPSAAAASTEFATLERVIGRVQGHRDGACVVIVAGIHGNEPAGVRAGRRVLHALRSADVAGDVVFVAGNLAGLRAGRRFAVRDLNRGWNDAALASLRAQPRESLQAEDAEQRALDEAVSAAFSAARGPRILVDLHTSSAPGVPFVLFGDTTAQASFVRALPIPLLLGLVEQVDGIMAEHFTRQGATTLCIEGGQHDDPRAQENLHAAIWISLARAGVVAASRPEVNMARALLEEARAGLPHILEVTSRHALLADDEFVMEPGFLNISRAHRGQLLARDRRGEIRALADGAVVLPLYQKQGSDGFFWAREIHSRRLDVAALLRKVPLTFLVGLLPGIAVESDRPESVTLSSGEVLPQVMSLLRLLGFRRERTVAGRRVWERMTG